MVFRLTDVNFTIVLGTFGVIFYTVVFIAFVITVVKEFRILHGYPRHADLLPGIFVSDRYSWGWYFLIFNLARAYVFSFYLWSFLDLRGHKKRIWFERLIGYVLAFDVIMWIFFLIVSCFLCNNSFWPSASSLCNDELSKWCTVWGDSYPERCPPALPLSDQCDLDPNPVWVRWVFFHMGFCLLDLFLWALNDDMSRYIRNMMYYEQQY